MIKVTVKERKRRCNKLRRLQLHDVIAIERRVDSIIGLKRQWSSPSSTATALVPRNSLCTTPLHNPSGGEGYKDAH